MTHLLYRVMCPRQSQVLDTLRLIHAKVQKEYLSILPSLQGMEAMNGQGFYRKLQAHCYYSVQMMVFAASIRCPWCFLLQLQVCHSCMSHLALSTHSPRNGDVTSGKV